jgi:hypothetical protein
VTAQRAQSIDIAYCLCYTPSMNTHSEKTVGEIVANTYGRGAMSAALTNELVKLIDNYEGDHLEEAVRMRCWNYFSGGTTASACARSIVDALDES